MVPPKTGTKVPAKQEDKPEAKAEATPVAKAPRKKPVRKSPALKDYPNKLAWLKASTEYEESQSEHGVKAKITRLDKRIAAKVKAIEDLHAEVAALETERHLLVPVGLTYVEGDVPEVSHDEAEAPTA